jgi:hypothetical protein
MQRDDAKGGRHEDVRAATMLRFANGKRLVTMTETCARAPSFASGRIGPEAPRQVCICRRGGLRSFQLRTQDGKPKCP